MYLCFFFQVKVFIEIKVLAGEICKKKKWDFFPGEIEKTKLKKNVFKFEKKNRGKMYVCIFSQIKFFFLSRKKV